MDVEFCYTFCEVSILSIEPGPSIRIRPAAVRDCSLENRLVNSPIGRPAR